MTSRAMPSPITNHWFERDMVSRLTGEREGGVGRQGKKTLMSVSEAKQGGARSGQGGAPSFKPKPRTREESKGLLEVWPWAGCREDQKGAEAAG